MKEEYLRLLEALSREPPGRAVLVGIVDALIAVLDAERAFLFRLRPSGGFRVLVARNRDGETIKSPSARMSHHAVRHMLRSGKPYHVVDARRDRRYRSEDARSGGKPPISLAVHPVYIRDELAGGIYADHRFHQFDETWITDVQALQWVHLCSLALLLRDQNARLRRSASGGIRSDRSPSVYDPVAPTMPVDGTLGDAVDPARVEDFQGLLSANPDMLDLFAMARSLGASDLPVLILGETGTGKSHLALAIHGCSQRAGQPFVTVGGGSVPPNLAASELLGHKRGSFTGALADHSGLLQQANGGTLFLDDLADMDLELQAKLLRVLEERRVRPLGAQEAVDIDVRVLAASARDPEMLIQQGRLREDLYFRLKGAVLELPPLRERREDIGILAEHFLARHADREPPPVLATEARARLEKYSWPGNTRELENEMRRLAVLGLGVIPAAQLSRAITTRGATSKSGSSHGEDERLEDVLQAAERRAVAAALDRAAGNKSEAARRLGITRKALYRRLARHGLPERSSRSQRPPSSSLEEARSPQRGSR